MHCDSFLAPFGKDFLPMFYHSVSDKVFVLGMGSLFKLVWGHGM